MVSKNGRLLLNVGPKPDGTIPEQAKERLLEIGAWLKLNGEALYGSTAWIVYGEGPTELIKNDLVQYVSIPDSDFEKLEQLIIEGKLQSGHYTQSYKVNYKPEDIRFTVKGDSLYAICLGWPEKEITIESLGTRASLPEGEISTIKMLGVEEELEWIHKKEGLVIKTPSVKPCKHAYTFKIIRK